jgi:hypothetical protein
VRVRGGDIDEEGWVRGGRRRRGEKRSRVADVVSRGTCARETFACTLVVIYYQTRRGDEGSGGRGSGGEREKRERLATSKGVGRVRFSLPHRCSSPLRFPIR